MHCIQEVKKDILWVGGSDRRLALFENMFPLEAGVSYNAYIIKDEKTILMDTVDPAIFGQFLQNVEAALGGRSLDYLLISHMEPDHGGAVLEMLQHYPGLTVVGSKKAHQLFCQFFPEKADAPFLEVGEGDTLSLGKRSLQFISAPMVHWPEVLFSYMPEEKILFSADAFGTFGALSGNLFADEMDFDDQFLSEARRYYANIVGKFGPSVQGVLKKAGALEIEMLCPLHGPIWRKELGYILSKYDLWSRYAPEAKGVAIFYASMYGHTESAVSALAAKLGDAGVADIRMVDVSKTHPSYCVALAWKYSNLVLAAPTYNMGLYYPMNTLLHELAALNLQNRKVSLIANHSWASAAMKVMTEKVSSMKNVEILGEPLDILSSLTDPAPLDAMAKAIADSLR